MAKKQETGKELVKVEVIPAQRDLSKQIVQAAKNIASKAAKFVSPKAPTGYRTYIESQDDLVAANALMTELATHIKTIEAKRKELTQPFVDGKKALDNFFNGPKNELQRWLDDLKEATKRYLILVETKRREEEEEAERKRQEQLRKLEERMEKAREDGNDKAIARIEQKQQELAEAIVAPKTAAAELGAGTGIRKNYTFRIVDFAKMPDTFDGFQLKIANESVLHKIANDSKGLAVIPGVEFMEDMTIVVQTNKIF